MSIRVLLLGLLVAAAILGAVAAILEDRRKVPAPPEPWEEPDDGFENPNEWWT